MLLKDYDLRMAEYYGASYAFVMFLMMILMMVCVSKTLRLIAYKYRLNRIMNDRGRIRGSRDEVVRNRFNRSLNRR